MILMSLACFIGLAFGLHYKFLVLIPLTLAAGLAYLVVGIAHGQTIAAISQGTLLLAFGLQGGYMIGLTSRELRSQVVSRFMAVPSKRG
jgi:hypothetical protein